MNMISSPVQVSTEKFFDLPLSEQLIVWGVRLWVHGAKEGVNVHELLADGFEKSGARGGCSSLDRLMTVLSVSAIDTIDVRCTKCENVSPDEHRILGVLASWQCTGIGDHADTLFEKILTPTGVRHARQPAGDLAQSMKFAAMLIRPRRESTTSPTAVIGDDAGVSASTTIH